jgi:hypothetical protein
MSSTLSILTFIPNRSDTVAHCQLMTHIGITAVHLWMSTTSRHLVVGQNSLSKDKTTSRTVIEDGNIGHSTVAQAPNMPRRPKPSLLLMATHFPTPTCLTHPCCPCSPTGSSSSWLPHPPLPPHRYHEREHNLTCVNVNKRIGKARCLWPDV